MKHGWNTDPDWSYRKGISAVASGSALLHRGYGELIVDQLQFVDQVALIPVGDYSMRLFACFLPVLFSAVTAFAAEEDDAANTAADVEEAAILEKLKEIGITASRENEALTTGLPASLENDAALEHLKGLTRLRCLYLHNEKITDAGLEHLKGLKNLDTLWLINTKVTDKGLRSLQGLTRLESLHLAGTRVTDAGLESIKGLTRLRMLSLGNTAVTGSGLVHLKGMHELQCLNLGDKIREAELVHLQKLDKLGLLTLPGAKITATGLAHLQKVPHLNILDLRGTTLDDASLERLGEMPNLGRILLGGTKVTEEGAEKLRQALPNAIISTSTNSYQ
jgi:Leucine-rich repeat (LRR) protein